MLSGTSTQSPVSSVLTMPNVSMPTVSMPTANMATTNAGLTDVFLSVPDLTGGAGFDTKPDLTGLSGIVLIVSPCPRPGTTILLLCPLLLLIPQTISIWACNLEVKQNKNVIFVAGLPLAINPSAAFGTSSAGASGAGQILGQTPVAAAAPQLILTGNTLQQSGGQTAMQQLLIPVSTGGYQTSSETSSKLLLLSGTYWFNLLNVRVCFYTQ